MSIQNSLPSAVSGLRAQSFRAAEIANNMVDVNTTGFKSGEVLTLSVVAGGQGSGVQPIRRESVRVAEDMLGQLIDIVA